MTAHYVLACYDRTENPIPSYYAYGKWTLQIRQAQMFESYNDAFKQRNEIGVSDGLFDYQVEHCDRPRSNGYFQLGRLASFLPLAASSFAIGFMFFLSPIYWAIAWMSLVCIMAVIGWRTKSFDLMMARIGVALAFCWLGSALA